MHGYPSLLEINYACTIRETREWNNGIPIHADIPIISKKLTTAFQHSGKAAFLFSAFPNTFSLFHILLDLTTFFV